MSEELEEYIRSEAEKYHDGRENDPAFISMMRKLYYVKNRAKGRARTEIQSDLGYAFKNPL